MYKLTRYDDEERTIKAIIHVFRETLQGERD